MGWEGSTILKGVEQMEVDESSIERNYTEESITKSCW